MSEEILDKDNTSEENTDQENTDVDVDALQAENTKLKAIIMKKKEKLANLAKDDEPEEKHINNKQDSPTEEDRLERIELRQEGYSKDIVDEIMKQGGKKFLETKLGKIAVEQLVEQSQAEKAVDIKSTIKSPTGQTIGKEDLQGMSSKDMEKLLPKSQ